MEAHDDRWALVRTRLEKREERPAEGDADRNVLGRALRMRPEKAAPTHWGGEVRLRNHLAPERRELDLGVMVPEVAFRRCGGRRRGRPMASRGSAASSQPRRPGTRTRTTSGGSRGTSLGTRGRIPLLPAPDEARNHHSPGALAFPFGHPTDAQGIRLLDECATMRSRLATGWLACRHPGRAAAELRSPTSPSGVASWSHDRFSEAPPPLHSARGGRWSALRMQVMPPGRWTRKRQLSASRCSPTSSIPRLSCPIAVTRPPSTRSRRTPLSSTCRSTCDGQDEFVDAHPFLKHLHEPAVP